MSPIAADLVVASYRMPVESAPEPAVDGRGRILTCVDLMGGGGLNGPNQRLSRGPSTSQMPRGYTHMHTRKGPHRCISDTASVPPKRGLAVSPGSGVGHGEGILRERELSLTQHTDTQHESLDSNMATSIR